MTELQRFLQEHTKELVVLGERHGCTFTEDDVAAAAQSQLAEQQLAEVQGGATVGYTSPDWWISQRK